jgi:hypothetical protein
MPRAQFDNWRMGGSRNKSYRMWHEVSLVEIVEFTLVMHTYRGNPFAGSGSFDEAYAKLLRRIAKEGVHQTNKKGTNRTLPFLYNMQINLYHQDDASLLPLTTLRQIYHNTCILEALWYLRGEDNVRWLQATDIHIWDSQAPLSRRIKSQNGLQPNVGRNHRTIRVYFKRPICTDRKQAGLDG